MDGSEDHLLTGYDLKELDLIIDLINSDNDQENNEDDLNSEDDKKDQENEYDR